MRPVLLAALLLAAPACTQAIWSELRYNEGQMPTKVASGDRQFHEWFPGVRIVGGVYTPDADMATKGEVLEVFGAPRTVLPQRRGDIFVYRLTDLDVTVLNINSGIFTGIFTPIYARLKGRQTDQLLYVFFDDKGAVRHVSMGRRLPSS